MNMNENFFDYDGYPIEVKIVTINNKRLSRAFLSQLEYAPCFNTVCVFQGEKILGYFYETHNGLKYKVIVWYKSNQLKKTKLLFGSYIYREINHYDNEFYSCTQEEFFDNEDYFNADSEQHYNRMENYRSFISSLEGKQIYFI